MMHQPLEGEGLAEERRIAVLTAEGVLHEYAAAKAEREAAREEEFNILQTAAPEIAEDILYRERLRHQAEGRQAVEAAEGIVRDSRTLLLELLQVLQDSATCPNGACSLNILEILCDETAKTSRSLGRADLIEYLTPETVHEILEELVFDLINRLRRLVPEEVITCLMDMWRADNLWRNGKPTLSEFLPE